MVARMDGADLHQNADLYNQRAALRNQNESLTRKIDLLEMESRRLASEKSRLLLLESKIGEIDATLQRMPPPKKHEFTYFMVSHRPFLAVIFAGVLLMTLILGLTSKSSSSSLKALAAVVATITMSGFTYSYACVLQREYSVFLPLLGAPVLAAALLVTFSYFRWRVGGDDVGGALRVGILTATFVFVLSVGHGLFSETEIEGSIAEQAHFSASFLIGFVLSTGWLFGWATTSSLLVSWTSSGIFQTVGIAALTLTSLLWVGADDASRSEGIVPILVMSVLLGLSITMVEAQRTHAVE